MNNYNDTVISTRIRLARNLENVPFTHRLNNKGKLKVIEDVRCALMDSNSALSNEFTLIKLWEIPQQEALALAENHLISYELAKNPQGSAVMLNRDRTVSIMINEEDHIRLQVIMPGFEPEKAYDLADKLDDLLNETLDFAFDEKLGYLTQCPTNLGTGLRASVMLHLPALQSTRSMPRIASELSKLGLTIRGFYGEGSEPCGAIYQLSNQISLGISEQAAIKNLKSIAEQLISQERRERETMLKNIAVKDKIHRSFGLLKHAKIMSHAEATALLSNLRLGAACGEFDASMIKKADALTTMVQPATLMKLAGKEMTPEERDEYRAQLIQNQI